MTIQKTYLCGEESNRVDDKGRVAIPTSLLTPKNTAYYARRSETNPNKMFILYPETIYQSKLEDALQLNEESPDRIKIASARRVELDSQKRVNLGFLGLRNTRVSVNGNIDCIVIQNLDADLADRFRKCLKQGN